MSLKRKVEQEDIDLLEVFEDEIWLGEFLRSTNDGEVDKTIWPSKEWEYRDYQRQFLTDDNKFILYTGGRSIGKCSPGSARVLTTEGYRTVAELARQEYFITYALSPELTLEKRRGVAMFDKISPAYTIVTETGHTFSATGNHPILTPNGYKILDLINEDDEVAVTTYLPYSGNNEAFLWHELRFMGYILLQPKFKGETYISPRFKRIGAELEVIADRFLVKWTKDVKTGAYKLHRLPGPYKHPITTLLDEVKLKWPFYNGITRIPLAIMTESLNNIKIFLEALFAQFADLSHDNVSLSVPSKRIALELQELLLRYAIETRIAADLLNTNWSITILNENARILFWDTFNIPGVSAPKYDRSFEQITNFMRFEKIVSKYKSHNNTDTYAVYVHEHNNYISDNIMVHNSVVLEDKIIYNVINSNIQFPDTKDSVLVTPNQAQMTPILNKIINRFQSGKTLREFLNNRVNRAQGIMEFQSYGPKPLTFNFRIAGNTGETNMVGLHIPRIIGDECQLFPIRAFQQLTPAFNGWESKVQQIWAGVSNGLRTSVLYMLDTIAERYKKYHIPSPNNPFYTYEQYISDLKQFGGENGDEFQNLVLGEHGAAAFQIIPREIIKIEPFEKFPFYNFRYSNSQTQRGIPYKEHLKLPEIPFDNLDRVMLAIDPGFVDGTIIQVLGRDKKHIWRTYVRYRLTRIEYNEQEEIIDWIASYYRAHRIAIDIGSGGNGASIMHHLIHGNEYRTKNYAKRIFPVQFSENLIAGYDENGEELIQDSKSYAANELAKVVQAGQIIFSEIDYEGISQLERIAKRRTMSGRDTFFVLNEHGSGASQDDHIFASYVCFVLGIREEILYNDKKSLANPVGTYT